MTQKARVLVTIKKDVLDPSGEAVKKSLSRFGLTDLAEVRIGKVVDISIGPNVDLEKHLPMIKKASMEILSNPIVEDFTIDLITEKSDDL